MVWQLDLVRDVQGLAYWSATSVLPDLRVGQASLVVLLAKLGAEVKILLSHHPTMKPDPTSVGLQIQLDSKAQSHHCYDRWVPHIQGRI